MPVRALVVEVIKEAIRKKILYFIFLLTFFLLAFTPRLPSFEIGVQITLFRDVSLGLALICIAILSITFSATQISQEIEKKTIYHILSKPVRRHQVISSKFIGVVLLLAISCLLIALIISAVAFFNFNSFDISFYPAIFSIFLEGIMLSAFVLFISTFSTPVISVFAAILFYFAGHVKTDYFGIITADMRVGSIPYYLAKTFSYILPDLELFNFNEIIARGVQIPAITFVQIFLYSVIYSLIFLILGNIVFTRKDV